MKEPPLQIAGWHEEIALPELGIEKAFAKLDTGADHSTLHARDVNVVSDDADQRVEFTAPLLRRQETCEEWPGGGLRRVSARLVDERIVRSSNGSDEKRWVVLTSLRLGDAQFETRFTLTNREGLRFPVLIGRDALSGLFLVDSGTPHRLAPLVGCPDLP